MDEMLICDNCDADNPADAIYCRGCGERTEYGDTTINTTGSTDKKSDSVLWGLLLFCAVAAIVGFASFFYANKKKSMYESDYMRAREELNEARAKSRTDLNKVQKELETAKTDLATARNRSQLVRAELQSVKDFIAEVGNVYPIIITSIELQRLSYGNNTWIRQSGNVPTLDESTTRYVRIQIT